MLIAYRRGWRDQLIHFAPSKVLYYKDPRIAVTYLLWPLSVLDLYAVVIRNLPT